MHLSHTSSVRCRTRVIGTVLILEWINVEYLGNTRYDAPPLRFAKAFTTLGIALGIAATFQVCVAIHTQSRIQTMFLLSF